MNKSKFKRIIFLVACFAVLVTGAISSVDAASKSKKVAGGTIIAYANYHTSGNKRWTYYWAHTLDSYNNVKASGVTTYREFIDENELFIGGQLYKVDFGYNTTKLGTADFIFNP